jgi:mRNA interferase RelE/StbE
MMRYEIQLTPVAVRELRRLSNPLQKRLGGAIERLRSEPRPSGVKKLQGEDGLYRVRVGEYRIVYEIRDALLIVVVVRIGSRQQVYKRR